jgi:putative hemolysin
MGTSAVAFDAPAAHDGSMRRCIATITFGAAVGLVGCGSDAETPDTTPAGLANPASVFCVEQGGTVEIVSEADGEVGYCTLPDGTRIEEWDFFRSQTPTATDTP